LSPRRIAAASPSPAPSAPAPTPPPEESAPAPLPPEQERGPFPPTPLKLAGGLAEVWEADGYVKVRFPGGAPTPGTPECRIKNELKDQEWTFYGKERAWTKKTGKAPDRARQEARLALAHELGDEGRVPGGGAAVPTYSAPEPLPTGRRGSRGARSEPEPEPVVVEGTIHARLVGRDVAFSPASYLGPEVFEVYKCACYGGIFHKRTNTYRAHPLNAQQAIANLTTAGFTVDVAPGVRARIEETTRERARAVEQATARATALDAMLKLEGGEVFPHQFEGIRWLADRLDRGALLADDMGLGKTIQQQDSTNSIPLSIQWIAVASPLPDGNVPAGTDIPALTNIVDSSVTWEVFTEADFTQPAAGASVTATCDDVTHFTLDGSVFVAGAGWFTVTAIDGVAKTATLHNQGHAGAIVTLQA
jgi:hypothetical protein